MSRDLRMNPWVGYGMMAILLISGAVNVVLANQLRSTRKVIDIIKAENQLQIGKKVPNIEGNTPDGAPVEINFSKAARPTILYVFTPTCGWCKRNFENMAALRRSVGDQYAFVGVSLTSKDLAAYVKEHGIDYPVVSGISDVVRDAYRMGGTPMTIVVAPDNKVLKVWLGAYQGQLFKEVSSYFNVTLPGLSSTEDVARKN